MALNKSVTVVFNTAMDPSTLDAAFTLKLGATEITGVGSYLGNTYTFNPGNDLLPNNTYTATVSTLAKSALGVPMAANYVWTFKTVAPAGPPPIDLRSAANFGILAGAGITNNAGFSEIRNMNVGISPGGRGTITGFPPGKVVNGAIHAADDASPPGIAATFIQAKQDLADAYDAAASANFPAPVLVAGDQGGKTLAPGIYKSASTMGIAAGDLTLDAQGNPDAVWIFQIASGFTTIGGAGGNVILIGGAQAKNVFWQVGSSAVIGDFTSFKGTVLALTSITLNSDAVVTGRMLARNGAVVLTNTNFINKP